MSTRSKRENKSYSITQLYPRIFKISCPSHVDLARLFLRYQEYYECPQFKDKKFTLLEYKDWYITHCSKRRQFTYASDWAGFNVPGMIVPQCWSKHELGWSTDKTDYDDMMLEIWKRCKAATGDDPHFYLIGSKPDKSTLRHEIAHGFFYLNDRYRSKMTGLVGLISPLGREQINKLLERMGGYDLSVYVDEIQAYIVEGHSKFRRWAGKELVAQFVETFEKISSLRRSDTIVA